MKSMFLQKFVNCERGEMNLLAITITITLATLAVVLVSQMFTINEVIEKRLNTYACFNYTINKIRAASRFMMMSNGTIATAKAAQLVTPSPHWKIVIKSAQVGQNLYLAQYHRDTLTNKECNPWNQLQIIKKFPYRRKSLLLIRDHMGLAILRKRKDSLSVASISRRPFLLTARYTFSPHFKITGSKEKNISAMMPDLLP